MTKYCDKCEEPMARAEEATLIDGERLCLDCLPENQMTFEQFQATRKKVTAPYMPMNEDGDYYTYLDTFTGEGVEYVEECINITIFDDGTYYVMLDRSEYQSSNLEEIEKLLFEFYQENK